jgi:hypothetical protein
MTIRQLQSLKRTRRIQTKVLIVTPSHLVSPPLQIHHLKPRKISQRLKLAKLRKISKIWRQSSELKLRQRSMKKKSLSRRPRKERRKLKQRRRKKKL